MSYKKGRGLKDMTQNSVGAISSIEACRIRRKHRLTRQYNGKPTQSYQRLLWAVKHAHAQISEMKISIIRRSRPVADLLLFHLL